MFASSIRRPAAGGCGLLLCQIAKICGARVIGAVSTPAKAEMARCAGADEVIVYSEQDFAVAAKQLTGGKGVDVVYDAVGLDTYEKSMDSLKTRGCLALYGEASGLVPPFDVRMLVAKGSLYLTRTGLHSYVESRAELLERTNELFGWMASRKLKCEIYTRSIRSRRRRKRTRISKAAARWASCYCASDPRPGAAPAPLISAWHLPESS